MFLVICSLLRSKCRKYSTMCETVDSYISSSLLDKCFHVIIHFEFFQFQSLYNSWCYMEYLDIAIVIFSYNGAKPPGGGNLMSSLLKWQEIGTRLRSLSTLNTLQCYDSMVLRAALGFSSGFGKPECIQLLYFFTRCKECFSLTKSQPSYVTDRVMGD